ncbi:MAG: hypothetical protein RL318_1081 [Fibrobacterota bacterium]
MILLHGLCRTSRSMDAMARHLAGQGYLVINLDYPSRKERIETLAERTLATALADPRLERCTRIHFVTHSMGGILVRWFLGKHALPKLGRVVMLGPPNRGSEVVDTLRNTAIFRIVNGPAGQQLGTDPRSLPEKLGPVSFELGVIAGDRSINPINSLMIEGPDDGKVSVNRTRVAGQKEHLVVHVPHPFLASRRESISHTLQFLRTGSFHSWQGLA